MDDEDLKSLKEIFPRWIDGYLHEKDQMRLLKRGLWVPDIRMDLLEKHKKEE